MKWETACGAMPPDPGPTTAYEAYANRMGYAWDRIPGLAALRSGSMGALYSNGRKVALVEHLTPCGFAPIGPDLITGEWIDALLCTLDVTWCLVGQRAPASPHMELHWITGDARRCACAILSGWGHVTSGKAARIRGALW